MGPRRETSDPCHSILTALAMKDVDPNWLLGSLYPDFIVGAERQTHETDDAGYRKRCGGEDL
jgi:hypothetical protein